MQWVFWVLAIVAYGSLAFTVIALKAGSGRGEDPSLRIQPGNASWLAIVGLISGIAVLVGWAKVRVSPTSRPKS